MTATYILRSKYLGVIEKAAPGGAPTPAEGLTKGGSAPMADQDFMDARRDGARQVGRRHG